jgi:hypothetical protein
VETSLKCNLLGLKSSGSRLVVLFLGAEMAITIYTAGSILVIDEPFEIEAEFDLFEDVEFEVDEEDIEYDADGTAWYFDEEDEVYYYYDEEEDVWVEYEDEEVE